MIKELINIEEKERISFKRHFIRNVVLEIVFDNLNKESLLKNKDNIQKQFKNLGFTKFGEMKQIEFKMNIEDDVPEQIQNDNEVIGLLLFDDNRKIRIELMSNKIIISIFKYLSFDNFVIDVTKMINVLSEIMAENNHINLISLGKQNTIISTDTKSFDDLTFILNKPLLSSIRESLIPFENFEYTRDEFSILKNGYKCKIGSNCLKRENDGEYEINLDISVTDTKQCDFNNLTEKLQGINNFIYSVFCWATSDRFKTIMNEEV